MGQIAASTERTFKENLREKAALFWVIAWPILWVAIDCFVFAPTGEVPPEVVALIRGSFTIAMMVFAAMIAGMISFPVNISYDRESGLLRKLLSMPVKPWRDSLGRVLGIFVFSALAMVLTLTAGFICGAEFQSTYIGVLKSIGFFFLVLLASSGVGMIIGTFIKSSYSAVMTGVGIAVGTAAMTGLFSPYRLLPSWLQAFAQIYPISSCNSSITFLLAGGKDMAGYDPLTTGHIALTIALSVGLFILGLGLYRRFCYGRK